MDLSSIEGRKTAVLRLQQIAMKARSNMLESLGDNAVSRSILRELYPYLFGEVNIVDLAKRILDADAFSDTQIMNLLVLCHKTPAVLLIYNLWYDNEDLIDPIEFMRTTEIHIL